MSRILSAPPSNTDTFSTSSDLGSLFANAGKAESPNGGSAFQRLGQLEQKPGSTESGSSWRRIAASYQDLTPLPESLRSRENIAATNITIANITIANITAANVTTANISAAESILGAESLNKTAAALGGSASAWLSQAQTKVSEAQNINLLSQLTKMYIPWKIIAAADFANSPTANLKPQVDIIQKGDPTIGTVVIINQTHWITACDTSEVLRKSAGWSQDAILHYLIKENAQVIFQEGATKDSKLSDRDLLARSESLMPFAKSTVLNHPYNNWYDHIADVGASAMYATYASDINIKATSNSMLETIGEYVGKIPSQTLQDFFVLDVREAVTSQMVNRYLTENPGKTVYIIYGSAHQGLNDNFGNASVQSVSWPELDARSSIEIETAINAAKTPQEQHHHIDQMWLASDLIWDKLQSPENQLAALYRIRTDAVWWDYKVENFKDYLKTNAKSEEISEAIETAFLHFNLDMQYRPENYRGIFEAFTPKRLSLALVGTNADEQKLILSKLPYVDPWYAHSLATDDLAYQALKKAIDHPWTRKQAGLAAKSIMENGRFKP